MANTDPTALRLGVVGSGGVVGTQLLELLEARALPIAELKLFGGQEQAGVSVAVAGVNYRIHALADPAQLAGLDVVFLAAPWGAAQTILDASPGPLLIDLSAASLPPGDQPLIAPGFATREQVRRLAATGSVRIPHPAALALATILDAVGESSFGGATLMLSASSMGKETVAHLVRQSADLLNGRLDLAEDERQAGFNLGLFPKSLELGANLNAQVVRLMGRASALVTQVVQIPVLHGSALALNLVAQAEPDAAARQLRSAPGVLLAEDEEPLTIQDAVGQEALLVSLVAEPAGYALWCVYDNTRRAALAALWVAECLLPTTGGTLS